MAIPGGLIGVGTLADPSLTRANKIVGQVVGKPGQMPEVDFVLFNRFSQK